MLQKLSQLSKYSTHATTTTILADWQYVQHIHENLAQKNIKEAFSCLINSSLNGVVLDKQTFNNTHTKMKMEKVCITYHEVLYQIYRENFKPCPLVVDWMKMLVQTRNQKLRALLVDDYKILNIQMPPLQKEYNKNGKDQYTGQATSTSVIKQTKIQNNVDILVSNQSIPSSQPIKSSRRVKKSIIDPDIIKIRSKTLPNEALKLIETDQNTLQLVEKIGELIKEKGIKIILSDVKLQAIEDFEQDDENMEQEVDQSQIDPQLDYLAPILSFNKLGIGKIQIIVDGQHKNAILEALAKKNIIPETKKDIKEGNESKADKEKEKDSKNSNNQIDPNEPLDPKDDKGNEK